MYCNYASAAKNTLDSNLIEVCTFSQLVIGIAKPKSALKSKILKLKNLWDFLLSDTLDE